MGKIDKQKEIIGYLKVIFGVFVAVDVSIVAWIFQNFDIASNSKVITAVFVAIFIVVAIVLVNTSIQA